MATRFLDQDAWGERIWRGAGWFANALTVLLWIGFAVAEPIWGTLLGWIPARLIALAVTLLGVYLIPVVIVAGGTVAMIVAVNYLQ